MEQKNRVTIDVAISYIKVEKLAGDILAPEITSKFPSKYNKSIIHASLKKSGEPRVEFEYDNNTNLWRYRGDEGTIDVRVIQALNYAVYTAIQTRDQYQPTRSVLTIEIPHGHLLK